MKHDCPSCRCDSRVGEGGFSSPEVVEALLKTRSERIRRETPEAQDRKITPGTGMGRYFDPDDQIILRENHGAETDGG